MTGAEPGQDRAVAVVPLRDGVSGKSRLAAVLDPDSRRQLVRVLARHVVRTLLTTDGIERVLVVTADPTFAREALTGLDRLGPRIEVIEQPADRPGLNPALEHAREVLAAAPARLDVPPHRVLVAHADLPALTAQDVAALLAPGEQVVVATDRNRSGTNLLLLPGGADGARFAFRFGTDSLASHLDEARRVGMTAAVVDRPGSAVDLDTTQDWSQLPEGVRAAVRQHVRHLP
ncbi:2-phospho-L-lactate guanylyltransferase [Pseudactinotalea terrae]|uniref:2-phospho-L-lactate guanylyltransferase n=1 Tax=Pseudactinotalea terrae TaxID=1743262 RepID=UPI0012E1B6CD|nr:2-phospho-L-lactate guanylyltransferase [Pseudactinotalea terrae]